MANRPVISPLAFVLPGILAVNFGYGADNGSGTLGQRTTNNASVAADSPRDVAVSVATAGEPTLGATVIVPFCCDPLEHILGARYGDTALPAGAHCRWDSGDGHDADPCLMTYRSPWSGACMTILLATLAGGQPIRGELAGTSAAGGPDTPPPPPDGGDSAEGSGDAANAEDAGSLRGDSSDESLAGDASFAPWPSSDHTLRCVVNLNGYAMSYAPKRWASVPLVTDLAVPIDSTGNPQARYSTMLNLLETTPPRSVVGTYISGGRVDRVVERYPRTAIGRGQISKGWLRHGTDRVNLSDSAAAGGFANLIVQECASRPTQLVFVDNIIHPLAFRSWFPWPDTCAFLARVRQGLAQQQKRLIANVAVASWAMSDVDADLLASSVDGMAFEMPFHKNARGDRARTRAQINTYRRWLQQGKVVVLIAVDRSLDTVAAKDEEARLIAGFAMIVRNPGDALFVAWPFFREEPDWAGWPRRLGPPSGDEQFVEDHILTRVFQNGTLEVNVLTKSVEIR